MPSVKQKVTAQPAATGKGRARGGKAAQAAPSKANAYVQRAATPSGGTELPAATGIEAALHSSKGSGRAMSQPVQRDMEARFGTSFGGVRIHTNAQAGQLSRQLNARAFTHGQHIYFGSGQYNPHTRQGSHLLAHELTHTLQQQQQPQLGRMLMRSCMLVGPTPSVLKMGKLIADRKAGRTDMVPILAFFEQLNKQLAFNPGVFFFQAAEKASLQCMLETDLSADDAWLAITVLKQTLGKAVEAKPKKGKDLNIDVKFMAGTSSRKALVMAGVHGSERQGVEVGRRLFSDLEAAKSKGSPPYFNVYYIPVLFPHNEAKARRERGGHATNRGFPAKGSTNPKDTKLEENQRLIRLMNTYQPERIISIHGTWRPSSAGVFSDPTYVNEQRRKAMEQEADAYLALYGPQFVQWIKTLALDLEEYHNARRTEMDRRLALETAMQAHANFQAADKADATTDHEKAINKRSGANPDNRKYMLVAGNDLDKMYFLSHVWSADRRDPPWNKARKLYRKHQKLIKTYGRDFLFELMVQVYDHKGDFAATKTALAGKVTLKPADDKVITAMITIYKEYMLGIKKLEAYRKTLGTAKAPVVKGKRKQHSLGSYAAGRGISVFTVEPAINAYSAEYDKRKRKGAFKLEASAVGKKTREVELQSYADAIRTVLLQNDAHQTPE